MSIKKVTITTLVSTNSDKNAIRSAKDNLDAVVPMGNVLDQQISVEAFEGDLTDHVPVLDLGDLPKTEERPNRSEEYIG